MPISMVVREIDSAVVSNLACDTVSDPGSISTERSHQNQHPAEPRLGLAVQDCRHASAKTPPRVDLWRSPEPWPPYSLRKDEDEEESSALPHPLTLVKS